MKKKILAMSLCVVMLAIAIVGGTLAYFTDTDTETNTFTVGKVAITLDESPVNDAGVVQEGNRVKENTYKLIPGHEYTKDPIVHVDADSENSWIFIKVENQLGDIEAEKLIATKITDNGWTELTDGSGIYYKEYVPGTTATDLNVFEKFKLTDDADVSTYAGKTIKVFAYAIQKDGFTTPEAAWTELNN